MTLRMAITVLAGLAVGCAAIPGNDKELSLCFRGDPVNHEAGEAIDQIEVVASSPKHGRILELPGDWSAGWCNHCNSVSYTLACAHADFAEPDLQVFSEKVHLFVRSCDGNPVVKVRLWITRGPLGPGRIVDLSESDIILRQDSDRRLGE